MKSPLVITADDPYFVRSRPPFREFTVCLRSVVIERHEGIGLTIDEVIRRIVENWPPSEPDDPKDEDLSVWQGNRCLAIVRPDAEDKPVVTRFDDPGAGPVTSKPEVPPDPEGDPEPDDEGEDEDDGPDAPAARHAPRRARAPAGRPAPGREVRRDRGRCSVIDHPIFGAVMRPIPAGIAGDLIRAAIDRYHAAERWLKETDRIPDGSPQESWSTWASRDFSDAERQLVRAILATRDDFDWLRFDRAEKQAWPPCGVAHAGKLYLAMQLPDRDVPPGETDSGGIDVMRLMVVDQEDILDLPTPIRHIDDPDPDDGEDPEPDGDEDEDDGPDALAGRRALLRTRSPLFRGTIAFADPGEPDFLVQLEIIITSENVEDSPGFYDLPQSKEAGWISHAHGTMNIAVRTIS